MVGLSKIMLIRVGHYEIVKKGEPPCVGPTKLSGVTLEELKRPRRVNIPEALQIAYDKAAAPQSYHNSTASTETTPTSSTSS